MNIAVIGLGLIGGSIAMALKGFEGSEVTGVVRSQGTLELALERQVCDKVTLNPMEILPEADVVWLCMQPKAILRFLQEHKELVIDPSSTEKRYSAPLWGTVLSAAADALIVFYSITRNSDGTITDADFNFISREEFDRTYSRL
jgi:threonine dehydrogenase-like Zn-dependent dehydrogenase